MLLLGDFNTFHNKKRKQYNGQEFCCRDNNEKCRVIIILECTRGLFFTTFLLFYFPYHIFKHLS